MQRFLANSFFRVSVFLFYCHTNCTAQVSSSVSNPDSITIHLADPTIYSSGEKFYLYGTVEGASGNGFLGYQSADLKRWQPIGGNNGYVLNKGEAYGTSGFWAPQVFSYRNKFYMAYVANEQIAIAESESLKGPFTQQVKEPLAAPVKQIDPFVFKDDDGKIYLYHVRLINGNKIFVAELNQDLSGIKEQTLRECITASEQWENTTNASWPVTEGPSVIKHKGLYYLFYTANDFRNPDYAVGYATSNSPLGPWKKYEQNPIISKNLLGINGTGHGDFFKKNKQYYYVFHTHTSQQKVAPRRTALIKASFQKTKNGPDKMVVDKRSFTFLQK